MMPYFSRYEKNTKVFGCDACIRNRCGGQGWSRQPTPNDTLRSTVILSDNSVVFQIYAPH